MSSASINRLKTISDLHRFNKLKAPEHPLISLLDYSEIHPTAIENKLRWVQEFYTISVKRNVTGKYRYGQQSYDFDEGLMTFFAPEQVISVQLIEEDLTNHKPSGWILAIHPDFLFGTPLAEKIKKYPFFNYSVREALFLSEKEEGIINGLLNNIRSEYQANLDEFSQQIIISQLELLLNYAERFYKRQFLTRKITSHQILEKLELLTDDYFNSDDLVSRGLPRVQQVAENLNLTPDYLSSLLRNLTGLTTQQYIHNKLIERAKVKLSTTELSVSEIAYSLGFEHPQSFSKLFKTKTKQTPLEYRSSFN
ncbi:helix-turn-helix domain-containing protein [Croceivirga thetidis]|uniref:Helix-turn-helix transcriptional regulator n=1 Tax=Croceivirga thetidis TaxID=2721623 RepID=A0ABX1GNH1_9FLAO|nr:response regulator transcription factor [Croceivirga thetidis]NKI31472.1 helix-turn-helix transcriptional regulator [Croceivirga thetidis]